MEINNGVKLAVYSQDSNNSLVFPGSNLLTSLIGHIPFILPCQETSRLDGLVDNCLGESFAVRESYELELLLRRRLLNRLGMRNNPFNR